jgi:hypothetical protein
MSQDKMAKGAIRHVSSREIDKHPIEVGDIVKFVSPHTQDETTERFVILEHRGPRVLVEAVCDMKMKPAFVYLAKDLIKA